MKRVLIIGGSIIVLILLAINAIRENGRKGKEERQWFLESLDYDFSGEIDSIRIVRDKLGFVRFHLTRGGSEVNPHVENKLNRQLKENHAIYVLMFRPGDKIDIITRNPLLLKKGDSLALNSDLDQMTFYRDGKEIAKDKISSLTRATRE
jgi:hypothetical protein